MANTTLLPDELPVPQDDGACDHLSGRALPALALPAADGETLDLSAQRGRIVVFVYPRTGVPGQALPSGWDDIPGARGCTPQSCRFRDLHAEFEALGVQVFGLSSQSTSEQREAAERLHLPYPLLSDAERRWATALALPTFDADGMTLIRRLTLVVDDGVITRCVYPVFPPDAATDELLEHLTKTA